MHVLCTRKLKIGRSIGGRVQAAGPEDAHRDCCPLEEMVEKIETGFSKSARNSSGSGKIAHFTEEDRPVDAPVRQALAEFRAIMRFEECGWASRFDPDTSKGSAAGLVFVRGIRLSACQTLPD